jgi:hypothetical protein
MAERCNKRVVVLGGNGDDHVANLFYFPEGLSFDWRGNMYAADWSNFRGQQFKLE